MNFTFGCCEKEMNFKLFIKPVRQLHALWPNYTLYGPITRSMAQLHVLWPNYTLCGPITRSVAQLHALWPKADGIKH